MTLAGKVVFPAAFSPCNDFLFAGCVFGCLIHQFRCPIEIDDSDFVFLCEFTDFLVAPVCLQRLIEHEHLIRPAPDAADIVHIPGKFDAELVQISSDSLFFVGYLAAGSIDQMNLLGKNHTQQILKKALSGLFDE